MNCTENKHDLLLKFLQASLNSRSNITIHKEVSAWATAVLYFTLIIALYSILSEKSKLISIIEFKELLWFILLFLLFIIVIIHAQYGSNQNGRAVSDTYTYYLYKLINNEIIKDNKWEMSKNQVFPLFLKDEIEKRNKKYHRLLYVFPFMSLIWLIIKVTLKLYFLLTFWRKSRCKWEEKIEDGLVIDKINLIESSIYSILIIHTGTFLIWVHKFLK